MTSLDYTLLYFLVGIVVMIFFLRRKTKDQETFNRTDILVIVIFYILWPTTIFIVCGETVKGFFSHMKELKLNNPFYKP